MLQRVRCGTLVNEHGGCLIALDRLFQLMISVCTLMMIPAQPVAVGWCRVAPYSTLHATVYAPFRADRPCHRDDVDAIMGVQQQR